MANPDMTVVDLIALLREKATAPPPAASQLLVRHLQCKESVDLAHCLSEAMDRYAATTGLPLPSPSELLPPLG